MLSSKIVWGRYGKIVRKKLFINLSSNMHCTYFCVLLHCYVMEPCSKNITLPFKMHYHDLFFRRRMQFSCLVYYLCFVSIWFQIEGSNRLEIGEMEWIRIYVIRKAYVTLLDSLTFLKLSRVASRICVFRRLSVLSISKLNLVIWKSVRAIGL